MNRIHLSSKKELKKEKRVIQDRFLLKILICGIVFDNLYADMKTIKQRFKRSFN